MNSRAIKCGGAMDGLLETGGRRHETGPIRVRPDGIRRRGGGARSGVDGTQVTGEALRPADGTGKPSGVKGTQTGSHSAE